MAASASAFAPKRMNALISTLSSSLPDFRTPPRLLAGDRGHGHAAKSLTAPPAPARGGSVCGGDISVFPYLRNRGPRRVVVVVAVD